jgi:hypothetical protein
MDYGQTVSEEDVNEQIKEIDGNYVLLKTSYSVTKVFSTLKKVSFYGMFEDPVEIENNAGYKIWDKDGKLTGCHCTKYLGKKTICQLVADTMQETKHKSPEEFLFYAANPA